MFDEDFFSLDSNWFSDFITQKKVYILIKKRKGCGWGGGLGNILKFIEINFIFIYPCM